MLAAFRAAGFKKTISHQEPHALLDWLATKLNEKDQNYISDSILDAASKPPTTAELSNENDELLTQLFPDLKNLTMDIRPMSDQIRGGTLQHELPAWLDEELDEGELEQQLRELAEEGASIRAQMQEIQLLDSQLNDSSSPSFLTEDLSNSLAVERAAISSLDAAVQERASRLTWTLKEICEASKPQNARLWLILADSAEREGYLREEVRMTERVAKQLQLVEARDTRGLSEVKPALDLSPEDEKLEGCFNKLSSFDPFGSSSPHRGNLDQALDASEIQKLLSEGARLRECMKEAEAAYVEAKLDAAQHAAELNSLRALTSQQGNIPGSCLQTKAERDWLGQMEDESSKLEAEEDRLVSTALSQVLDDLGKLQDARLLQSQYELQGRVQSTLLSQRSILIKAMLSASSRRRLVDVVQEAEKAELKKLEAALSSLEHLLTGLVSSSDRRCARYMEARPSLGQPSPRASSLMSLLGEMDQGRSLEELQKMESEVERLVLGPRSDPRSLEGVISQSRSIAQESRSILVHPPPPLDNPLPGPPSIEVVLHPPSLDAKLGQVRMAAYELNELINQAKQEHDRFHALISEHKEEMMAERSVLEWFHLEPEKLSQHVANMEGRA